MLHKLHVEIEIPQRAFLCKGTEVVILYKSLQRSWEKFTWSHKNDQATRKTSILSLFCQTIRRFETLSCGHKPVLIFLQCLQFLISRLIWLLLFSDNSVVVIRKVSLDRKMRVATWSGSVQAKQSSSVIRNWDMEQGRFQGNFLPNDQDPRRLTQTTTGQNHCTCTTFRIKLNYGLASRDHVLLPINVCLTTL